MVRRLSLVLLFVLTLGACAGSERVAVDAGGDSLTRDQLVSLTTSLQNVSVEDGTAVSADDLRQVASAHLESTALFAYIDDTGQQVPEDLRGAAQDFVTDQLAAGAIREIAFDSAEFEAYVEILMTRELRAVLPLGPDEFQDIVSEYSTDFEVESRLGNWDSSIAEIVAP